MRKLITELLIICFISGCGVVEPVEFVGDITNESFKRVSGVGGFIFEILSSKEHLFVRDVSAHYDDDKLVIRGRVKRGSLLCCESVTGHVDIAGRFVHSSRLPQYNGPKKSRTRQVRGWIVVRTWL